MKKINKAIKIAGAIVCAALLFFNVSLNGKSSSDNLDLSALTKISEANAECVDDPPLNNGRCSQLTGNCYWDPDSDDCDYTQG